VRRDPFAMLPFCGYNMSDYFAHWLEMGKRLQASGVRAPRIFCVNWFRTGADGKFVWPGFGENMRVLKWMLERVEGKAGGAEHLFGVTPRYDDITWDGLPFDDERFAQITAIDPQAWKQELALHRELFHTLGQRLPAALTAVERRLGGKV